MIQRCLATSLLIVLVTIGCASPEQTPPPQRLAATDGSFAGKTLYSLIVWHDGQGAGEIWKVENDDANNKWVKVADAPYSLPDGWKPAGIAGDRLLAQKDSGEARMWLLDAQLNLTSFVDLSYQALPGYKAKSLSVALLNPWFCRTGDEDFWALFDGPQGSNPEVLLVRPNGRRAQVYTITANPPYRAMYFGMAANLNWKLLWTRQSDGWAELWIMQSSGCVPAGICDVGRIQAAGLAVWPYRTMSTFVDGIPTSETIWDRLIQQVPGGEVFAMALDPQPKVSSNPPEVQPAPTNLSLARGLTHPNPNWVVEAYTDLRPRCGVTPLPPFNETRNREHQNLLDKIWEASGRVPPEVERQ